MAPVSLKIICSALFAGVAVIATINIAAATRTVFLITDIFDSFPFAEVHNSRSNNQRVREGMLHAISVVPLGSTKQCMNNSREVKRCHDTRGNGQNLLPCSSNGKGKKAGQAKPCRRPESALREETFGGTGTDRTFCSFSFGFSKFTVTSNLWVAFPPFFPGVGDSPSLHLLLIPRPGALVAQLHDGINYPALALVWLAETPGSPRGFRRARAVTALRRLARIVREGLGEARLRKHVLGKICVERRLEVDQSAFAVIGIADLSDHEGSLAEAQALVAWKRRHRGPNGVNVDGDLRAEINAALFDGGRQVVADVIGISSRIGGDDDAATAANEFVHAQMFEMTAVGEGHLSLVLVGVAGEFIHYRAPGRPGLPALPSLLYPWISEPPPQAHAEDGQQKRYGTVRVVAHVGTGGGSGDGHGGAQARSGVSRFPRTVFCKAI